MSPTARLRHRVPILTVTLDELTAMFTAASTRLARYPYPTYSLMFSCSPHGIWPTTNLGYTPPDDRHYIDGCSDVLDTIAYLMLADAESPTGGRFTVTLHGAVRVRDGAPIVEFELIP